MQGAHRLLLRPLLHLLVFARVQHELVRVARRVPRVALRPVIGHRVREDRPRPVERRTRARTRLGVERCV